MSEHERIATILQLQAAIEYVLPDVDFGVMAQAIQLLLCTGIEDVATKVQR